VNHTWAVFSFVGAWQNYQKTSGLSWTIAMVTGATLPGRGVSCLGCHRVLVRSIPGVKLGYLLVMKCHPSMLFFIHLPFQLSGEVPFVNALLPPALTDSSFFTAERPVLLGTHSYASY